LRDSCVIIYFCFCNIIPSFLDSRPKASGDMRNFTSEEPEPSLKLHRRSQYTILCSTRLPQCTCTCSIQYLFTPLFSLARDDLRPSVAREGRHTVFRPPPGITQIGNLVIVNGWKAWSGITPETLGASHQNSAPNWNCSSREQGESIAFCFSLPARFSQASHIIAC
jgi:hypothetical protein